MPWWMKQKLQAEADEKEGSPPVAESGDSNLWDDLLDDGSEVEVEASVDEAPPQVVEEVGREAEPEAAPAEVVAEAPVEAPTPTAVVEEKVEVVAPPPAKTEVSQPQAPQPAPPTAEEIAEFQRRTMSALAAQYALPQEEAESFQLEPEKVLPALAARLHLHIYDHVMRSIAAQAPTIVEQTMARQQGARAAEDAFYSRWDDLRPHAAQVQQVAQMWRQMYPRASLDEAIEGIGQAAKALLGLGGMQAAAPTTAAPAMSPPPVPARPSARGPMRPVVKQTMSVEEQAFADLAKEFTEEY